MRHVALILASLTLLAFAAIVIVPNRHALTMAHLGFSGVLILLAFALALPADFKAALTTVTSSLPAIRGATHGGGGV